MVNNIESKRKDIGSILKIGVIFSCTTGIVLHLTADTSGFMNRIFLAFTIQSNMWIAGICLLFLIIDIVRKNESKPVWLHVLRFMFTVSILLTYIVFAVLLSPLMELSYLSSLSNILLHTVTAVLAVADFIVDDFKYTIKPRMLAFSGLIMPLLYSVFFFIYYEVMNQMPVPYFFMDFKKYGWFTIGNDGIGVIYWMSILCIVLMLIGYIILLLKKKNADNLKKTVVITIIAMLSVSVVFSLLSIVF
ncbi:MAG: hypothetical protein WC332_11045 [Clostridia bacterium]